MRLIMPHLERAVADGQDVAARTAMLQGSLLAGLCFGSTDVAAVHCLAEALGGLYDTPAWRRQCRLPAGGYAL